MLFQAQRDLNLDLSRTFFVGDDARDAEAADKAGCPFAKISDDRPLIDWVRTLLTRPRTRTKEKHEKANLDYRA
jgi:phosphoglycolate phosphatase-like HAD superfamily hydrolase